jgi:hypothetical protein
LPDEPTASATDAPASAATGTPATTTAPAAAGTGPGTAPQEPATTPEAPADPLASIDADVLRKHPRVNAILGEKQAAWVQQQQAQQAQTAREKAEADLRALAETDPYAFSQKYLVEAQQKDLARQLDSLKGETRADYLKRIGQHAAEKFQFQPADFDALAERLKGVPDDSVVAVFNEFTVDLAAERKAQSRLAEWKATELTKEREAIRQEEAAKRLQGQARPGLQRPSGQPQAAKLHEIADWDEFDKQYEARFKRR